MWWAWVRTRDPHPGKRHPPSRASSALRSRQPTVLLRRPTSSTERRRDWGRRRFGRGRRLLEGVHDELYPGLDVLFQPEAEGVGAARRGRGLLFGPGGTLLAVELVFGRFQGLEQQGAHLRAELAADLVVAVVGEVQREAPAVGLDWGGLDWGDGGSVGGHWVSLRSLRCGRLPSHLLIHYSSAFVRGPTGCSAGQRVQPVQSTVELPGQKARRSDVGVPATQGRCALGVRARSPRPIPMTAAS